MIETKYIKINNPKRWYISHDDQEIDNLKFKVMVSNNNNVIVRVKGEIDKIQGYVTRFGADAIELTKAESKVEYDTKHSSKTVTCTMCNGTGTMTIPEWEVIDV